MTAPWRWVLAATVVAVALLLLPISLRSDRRQATPPVARESPCGPLAQQDEIARAFRAAHPHPSTAGSPSDVTRTPRPGATIEGRVTDAGGAPLAEVLVRASSEAEPPEEAAVARSNASGSFQLTGLGAGLYTLRTLADDHRRSSREHVASGAREIVLTLAPTARVVGCVVDAASKLPVPRFRVGDEWFEGTGGVFELTLGDAPGDAIEIRAPSYVPATLDPVDHGEYPPVLHTTLRLERGLTLHGRVIDADGDGVENARVVAVARGRLPYRSETTTSGDGRFRFDDLNDQLWMLTARAERSEPPEPARGTTALRLAWNRSADEVLIQLGKQGVLIDWIAEDLAYEVMRSEGRQAWESNDSQWVRVQAATRVIADAMMGVIASDARAGADPESHDDLVERAAARIPPTALTADVTSALDELRRARERRRAG